MNYLKNSLRVKLALTNPYEIKPEYTLFPKETASIEPSIDAATAQNESSLARRQLKMEKNSPMHRVPAALLGKNKLNSDYSILRFGFRGEGEDGVESKGKSKGNGIVDKCLGLQIGQYIWIEVEGDRRPYVPISRIDEPGFVDILVRDMTAKNIGSFTQKILKLQPGSPAEILGPGTQFLYKGYGKFLYLHPQQNSPVSQTYKNIGIITHSSAITTTYSLIQSIATNYDSRTGVSLLWLGDRESDFVFLEELAAYVEMYRLNMNLMLTSAGKGWLGPYGRLMADHVRDFMPFPGSQEIIVMSGLEGEFAYIPELVKKMGYKDYLNF